MRLWFDENKIQRLLAGTPKALHSRALADLEQNLIERGVRQTGQGNGFIVVDISRARFADVVTWLEDYAACVDVEPNDVQTILGRDIDALVLIRGLQNYGAQVKPKLSRLTPGEIVDACRHVSYELQATANQTGEDDPFTAAATEQAERDLVNAGLISEDDGTDHLGPKPEPQRNVDYSKYLPEDEQPNLADPFYMPDSRSIAGF